MPRHISRCCLTFSHRYTHADTFYHFHFACVSFRVALGWICSSLCNICRPWWCYLIACRAGHLNHEQVFATLYTAVLRYRLPIFKLFIPYVHIYVPYWCLGSWAWSCGIRVSRSRLQWTRIGRIVSQVWGVGTRFWLQQHQARSSSSISNPISASIKIVARLSICIGLSISRWNLSQRIPTGWERLLHEGALCFQLGSTPIVPSNKLSYPDTCFFSFYIYLSVVSLKHRVVVAAIALCRDHFTNAIQVL